MTLELVKPALEYVPEYKAALERGWSPDNVREAAAIREELEKIAASPAAFVAALDDPAWLPRRRARHVQLPGA